MKMNEAIELLVQEVDRAKTKHKGDFQNHREAHSVIEEEYDEFWDEIKDDRYDYAKNEAIQLGAMVLRYLTELH